MNQMSTFNFSDEMHEDATGAQRPLMGFPSGERSEYTTDRRMVSVHMSFYLYAIN